MSISDNIKAIRAQKGIAQAEVARRLDIEPSSYHRLENRGDKLTIEQVDSIAKALGITQLELLTWGDESLPVTNVNDDLIKLNKRIEELEKIVEVYERFTESSDRAKATLTAGLAYIGHTIGEQLQWGEVNNEVFEYDQDGGKHKVDTYFRTLNSQEYYRIAEYLFHRYNILYTVINYVIMSGMVDYKHEFISQFIAYDRESEGAIIYNESGGSRIRSKIIQHDYVPTRPSKQ